MAYKKFALNERVEITIYKRRGARNLRLSITSEGQVRVTIPIWAPYRSGLEFARSRQAWIVEQLPSKDFLSDGQAIGKAHRLHFVVGGAKPGSRVKAGEIAITYPSSMAITDAAVQKVASEAAIRALRQQAQALLPQRLAALAAKHDFSYKSITIKRLSGRWGSCDKDSNIVLNLYLMQLSWPLIDYVLLHELTHTRILRHGPDFWKAMTEISPEVKTLRKQIRQHRPVL